MHCSVEEVPTAVGTEVWSQFVVTLVAGDKRYIGTGRTRREAMKLANKRHRLGAHAEPWSGHPRPGSLEAVWASK